MIVYLARNRKLSYECQWVYAMHYENRDNEGEVDISSLRTMHKDIVCVNLEEALSDKQCSRDDSDEGSS